MSSRNKSEVWEYYSEDDATPFAICKLCRVVVMYNLLILRTKIFQCKVENLKNVAGAGSLRAARGKPEFFRFFLKFSTLHWKNKIFDSTTKKQKNSTLSNPTVCGHFLLTLILLNIIIICHIIWYLYSSELITLFLWFIASRIYTPIN